MGYVAVPWLLPREVPAGGMEINGQYFPEGVEVSMSPEVVHTRVETFGPDPMAFRPERWIEASDKEKIRLDSNMIAVGHDNTFAKQSVTYHYLITVWSRFEDMRR